LARAADTGLNDLSNSVESATSKAEQASDICIFVSNVLVIDGTSPLCRAAIAGGELSVMYLKGCWIAVCLMLRSLRVGER
jgi:hypothetical protein